MTLNKGNPRQHHFFYAKRGLEYLFSAESLVKRLVQVGAGMAKSKGIAWRSQPYSTPPLLPARVQPAFAAFGSLPELVPATPQARQSVGLLHRETCVYSFACTSWPVYNFLHFLDNGLLAHFFIRLFDPSQNSAFGRRTCTDRPAFDLAGG